MDYAESKSELGRILNVSKPSIIAFSKLPGFPQKTEQGYNIEQVKSYLAKHELGPYRRNGPISNNDDLNDADVAELRGYKLKEEVRKLRLDNDEREKRLINPERLIHRFNLAIAAINNGFEDMIKRSIPKLVGLPNVHEAEAVLRHEVEILVNGLQNFDFDDVEVSKPEYTEETED